jgi:hypothetical protein
MTDESGESLEELAPEAEFLDVRSPAERWADSGRAGFERARALVESGRLDLAAFWWMIFILVLTLLQVYAALRVSGFDNVPGSTDWWEKASILSGSGGIILIFGSVLGVFLAAFSAGRWARLALRLAVGAGVWVGLAALLGVAVAIHTGQGEFGALGMNGAEQKVVSSIGELCFVGLGLVIAVVATILTDVGAADDPALS